MSNPKTEGVQRWKKKLSLRLAGTKRRPDIRNSIRTMRKRNPEHYNRVRGAARHSPSAEVIRRLSIFGRPAQCAAGIPILFGNALYQAIIVVLFNRELNDHGLERYFCPKKITRIIRA
jgi:hypothetical protein